MIEWETPPTLFRELDREFGFELDVCALPENAKCDRHFTPEADGLRQLWTGVCWMNPPYGKDIGLWIRKAFEHGRAGGTVVCLIPNRTEAPWFHRYCLKGELRFIEGRVHFVGGDRPRFGSVLVIFGPGREGKVSGWRPDSKAAKTDSGRATRRTPQQTTQPTQASLW